MRTNMASARPTSRPLALLLRGSLPDKIEMKTMLSMPRTISSAVSVSERDPGLGVADPVEHRVVGARSGSQRAVVAQARVELATPAFSVRCSTN